MCLNLLKHFFFMLSDSEFLKEGNKKDLKNKDFFENKILG
jgi:hypothetical protein